MVADIRRVEQWEVVVDRSALVEMVADAVGVEDAVEEVVEGVVVVDAEEIKA